MADQNPNPEQDATNQPNNQQQNAIDYGKIEEILNKREASIHSGIIKNYLKDQGLDENEAKGKGFSNSNIILNIYAPKNTKMMYAEPFSRYGQGERIKWDGKSKQSSFGSEAEIILQRGTKVQIMKVEKNGGRLYIDIDVIGNSH